MTDYVVVCLDDASATEEVVATRRIFTLQEANNYAATIARSRNPRIITTTEYLIEIEHWSRADRSRHLSWSAEDVEIYKG